MVAPPAGPAPSASQGAVTEAVSNAGFVGGWAFPRNTLPTVQCDVPFDLTLLGYRCRPLTVPAERMRPAGTHSSQEESQPV